MEDAEVAMTRLPSDAEPFSGLAFKVMADQFLGTLTFVRIYRCPPLVKVSIRAQAGMRWARCVVAHSLEPVTVCYPALSPAQWHAGQSTSGNITHVPAPVTFDPACERSTAHPAKLALSPSQWHAEERRAPPACLTQHLRPAQWYPGEGQHHLLQHQGLQGAHRAPAGDALQRSH